MNFVLKYWKEIILYVFLGCTSFAVLAAMDAVEVFYTFSRAHESYELDEFALAIPVLLVVVALFSIFRLRELHAKTLELETANTQLQAAYRDLKTLSQSQEKIMAVACHELKSPINEILMALQIVECAQSAEQKNTYLKIANNSAQQLRLYSVDILRVLRLIFGHGVNESESFAPRTIVQEAVAGARTLAIQKQLDFSLEFGPSLPESLEGYPFALRHVVQNLCSNCVKYTSKGKVTVRTDHEGTCLLLAISDTGPGIPPDMRQDIFEPFSTIESDSNNQATGVGLSIVKRLVDAFGGTINVRDNVPKGAVFEVALPLEYPA